MASNAAQWFSSPAAILGTLFVLLIGHHLLDKPAEHDDRLMLLHDRLHNMALEMREHASRLSIVEQKKIPPDVQLAFNEKITDQVKRLNAEVALAAKLEYTLEKLVRWLEQQDHTHQYKPTPQ